MTTPTPALRSAIAQFVDKHWPAANWSEEHRFGIHNELGALLPFLAPAPVEQAAREAAQEFIGDASPNDADDQMWRECDIDDLTAIITRHFQSLATEKGGEDSAKLLERADDIIQRAIVLEDGWPAAELWHNAYVDYCAARASTGKGQT